MVAVFFVRRKTIIIVDYDFCNNTKIIIALNKKAKIHNYQGGGIFVYWNIQMIYISLYW